MWASHIFPEHSRGQWHRGREQKLKMHISGESCYLFLDFRSLICLIIATWKPWNDYIIISAILHLELAIKQASTDTHEVIYRRIRQIEFWKLLTPRKCLASLWNCPHWRSWIKWVEIWWHARNLKRKPKYGDLTREFRLFHTRRWSKIA